MIPTLQSFMYVWIQVLKLIFRTFCLFALDSYKPASVSPCGDFPGAPDLCLTIFKDSGKSFCFLKVSGKI